MLFVQKIGLFAQIYYSLSHNCLKWVKNMSRTIFMAKLDPSIRYHITDMQYERFHEVAVKADELWSGQQGHGRLRGLWNLQTQCGGLRQCPPGSRVTR